MPSHHVCPWWLAYTFDNPLRKLFHNPKEILDEYVLEGMTVMDVGCGMGFFTLGMAELVGDQGKVIAVDLQREMLSITMKRATRKGLAHRIIPHPAESETINNKTPVDFILAFWMVHEVHAPAVFFKEIAAILKPSAKLLYAEPAIHVPKRRFNELLGLAQDAGLTHLKKLTIRFSHCALLGK